MFLLGLGKTCQLRPHLSAPTPQAHPPPIVVESRWLYLDQNAIQPVPQLGALQFLHNL